MTENPERKDYLTENPLSEREMEVAQLLVTGASNAEIALSLVISPHTVKVHLRNIFEKLRVNSRTEASLVLVQHGWVVVPGAEIQPAEATLAEPALPEPEPLADQPIQVMPWQRLYLVGVLLFILAAIGVPHLPSLAQSPANLLTDAQRTRGAPSALRMEPRWETRTPLQQPLSRLAMVLLGDKLYLIGGEAPTGEAVADVSIYDLATNEWSQAPPLPMPLANLAATVADNRIYVAGGSTDKEGGGQTVTDLMLVYDPIDNQWEELPPLPYPVAGAALAGVDKALYLIGGWDGGKMRDEIWKLDVEANTIAELATKPWQAAGQLEKARAFLGAVTVGGEIFVVGGYDGQRELNLVEVFTPGKGVRQLQPLGTPRGGLAVVNDGLAVYALGGGWTHPVETHERYDFATNSWSNFPSPVQGSWRNLAAAATGDTLHLAGGWSGDYLDTHLQYQSSFRAMLPVISND